MESSPTQDGMRENDPQPSAISRHGTFVAQYEPEMIEDTTQNGLNFKDEEFEHQFSVYWEARNGLAMKASLFIILFIINIILIFNRSFIETTVQSVFTCIIIFLMGINMLHTNNKESDYERYVAFVLFLLLLYFIIEYTILRTDMPTYTFVGYYICFVLFGKGYMQLRVNYLRKCCHLSLIIWIILCVTRMVYPSIVLIFVSNGDDKDSNNQSEFNFGPFFISLIILSYVNMLSIDGCKKIELGRRIMFVSILQEASRTEDEMQIIDYPAQHLNGNSSISHWERKNRNSGNNEKVLTDNKHNVIVRLSPKEQKRNVRFGQHSDNNNINISQDEYIGSMDGWFNRGGLSSIDNKQHNSSNSNNSNSKSIDKFKSQTSVNTVIENDTNDTNDNTNDNTDNNSNNTSKNSNQLRVHTIQSHQSINISGNSSYDHIANININSSVPIDINNGASSVSIQKSINLDSIHLSVPDYNSNHDPLSVSAPTRCRRNGSMMDDDIAKGLRLLQLNKQPSSIHTAKVLNNVVSHSVAHNRIQSAMDSSNHINFLQNIARGIVHTSHMHRRNAHSTVIFNVNSQVNVPGNKNSTSNINVNAYKQNHGRWQTYTNLKQDIHMRNRAQIDTQLPVQNKNVVPSPESNPVLSISPKSSKNTTPRTPSDQAGKEEGSKLVVGPTQATNGSSNADICVDNNDKTRNNCKIVTIQVLPHWYEIYEWIDNGYRLDYTFMQATKS